MPMQPGMEPASFNRVLISHAGPEAYAPMTRVILAKLGYLVLMPDEAASIRDLAEERPLVRLLDERLVQLQRQGRVAFHGSCRGQEVAPVAAALALRPSDWIFPALRESYAALVRGFPLDRYLAQDFGSSLDVGKGRQMPSHQSARVVNVASWSSCIGTQLPHARP